LIPSSHPFFLFFSGNQSQEFLCFAGIASPEMLIRLVIVFIIRKKEFRKEMTSQSNNIRVEQTKLHTKANSSHNLMS